MTVNLFEIQSGIYSKLVANAPLMAIVTGVYDDVPQAAKSESNAAYPFIVIGDDNFSPWDTDTEVGFEIDISIHIWSRYHGKKEMVDIASAIHNALDRQTINSSNFSILDIRHQSVTSFTESDGKTRHGITVFKINIEV